MSKAKVGIIAGVAGLLAFGGVCGVVQARDATEEYNSYKATDVAGIAVYAKEGTSVTGTGDGVKVVFSKDGKEYAAVYGNGENEEVLDGIVKTVETGGYDSAAVTYPSENGEDSFTLYADKGINFDRDGKAYLQRVDEAYYGNTASSIYYTGDADVVAFLNADKA